jgi:formylglycine-generating enzyme required for sulfatase activity
MAVHMVAAMPKKKPTIKKPTAKKKPQAKKAAPKPSGRTVRAILDAEENAGLNAEVSRRKAEEPAAKVTRESVVRYLVRTHLCTPTTATTQPLQGSGAALTVVQTKPVDDKHGRKMTVKVGTLVQVFRWVPPGIFTQGSPETEAGRWSDEGPQRKVKFKNGYWLADTPVTQALWEAVMGKNPSRFKGSELPVETVSWDECYDFIAKLNTLAPSLNLRLPTEAEWENACRAGTTTATWVGDLSLTGDGIRAPELDPIAWYYGNSPEGTQPVRGKQPNPLGLYDMLGNVYEWCQDFFGPYEAGRLTDPTGPAEGSGRVIRGGSWDSYAGDVRAADRRVDAPQLRHGGLGFRLARGHQV